MRLTVHLSGVTPETMEVRTKNGVVNKKKTFNTLSFKDVTEDKVSQILSELNASTDVVVTKHYTSGERVPGMMHGNKPGAPKPEKKK